MDECIKFDPHHNCDRCGLKKRVSELARQRGLWLCGTCWDNPEIWRREYVKANVLSDGKLEIGHWLDDRSVDEDQDDSTI